ncbi:MAG: hypothetical protein IMZ63_00425 [Actinobacteria bacterium]|nr:hypothetical protein [Actinomycetota bacterium]
MGYTSRKENVMLFLAALESILRSLDYKITVSGIMAAADVYEKESRELNLGNVN